MTTTPVSTKPPCLCILRSNFDKLVGASELVKKTPTLTMIKLDKAQTLFDIPSFLESRETCEKDPTRIHFIPYVTLLHIDSQAQTHAFTYVRGKQGGEGRLHDRCSIGFGGHVEEAPSASKTTKQVLIDNVIAELKEEVGFNITPYRVELALNNATVFLDESDSVGKVHLALAISINVGESEIKSKEPGIIEDVKLEKVSDIVSIIRKGPQETGREFESWSKIALGVYD